MKTKRSLYIYQKWYLIILSFLVIAISVIATYYIWTTSNISNLLIFSIIALTICFIIFVLVYRLYYKVYNTANNKLDALATTVKQLSDRTDPSGSKIEIIIDEKRKKFINIPSISFHYADHIQIKDFYNYYFKEPTIESLVSEISGEASSEIRANLPKVIEAGVGGKDISKWVSNIKIPDVPSNGMFLRYQRETIKNDQVILGLEEVDIELAELQAFEEAINQLHVKFGLIVDKNEMDKKSAELRAKAAQRTLIKLEQATGWVLIEGKFTIEIEGEFYKCIYSHPVNQYLSGQPGLITISVLIPSKSLEEHIKGNYAQSIGKSISLTVYGKVWQPIDTQTQVWDLQLTPLAVY